VCLDQIVREWKVPAPIGVVFSNFGGKDNKSRNFETLGRYPTTRQ